MNKKDQPVLSSNVFRAGAGAIIINEQGQVLAFERLNIPGSWQMPQGGLDEGEEPMQAVLREVEEETGLQPQDISLIAEYPDWLAYELPVPQRSRKHGRGQVQKWFIFRLTGSENQIIPQAVSNPEFRAWKWLEMKTLISETAPFRRCVYEKLEIYFREFLY
ncbi:MAG: RNA pyrophosphohydrolase [Bacteroidia bacterium]|nr:RNA pyrophosphohydrolase [Bacteroidia bacterium]